MRQKSLVRSLAMLIAGSSFLAIHVVAQNPDSPSIADAARVNREQKKVPAKPETVITNDTLNPAPAAGAPTVSSQTRGSAAAQASGNQTDSGSSNASTKSQLSPEDTARLKEEVAAIKVQLKDKQGEVELLKRLLSLDRDAVLSKPDSARDSAGKAKLESEQEELTLKEEEFAKLKAQLETIAPQGTADPTPPTP